MLHRSSLLWSVRFTVPSVIVAVAAVAACVGNDPNASGADGEFDAGSSTVDGALPTVNEAGAEAASPEAGPSCAAPTVSCGGVCIDPSSYANDGANCGSCGHDCGSGATCTARKCDAITILAPGSTSGKEVISVAVDSNAIYFDSKAGAVGTPHGSISKCPLTSCTDAVLLYDANAEVDTLLTTPSAPGYVYYTDNADDHIFRIVTDGGASSTTFPGTATSCPSNPSHCVVDLATGGGHPYPLATDGTNLYTFREYNSDGVGGFTVALPSGTTGNEFGEGTPTVDVGAFGIAVDPADASHRWLYVVGAHGFFAVETSAQTSTPVSLLTGVAPTFAGGIAVGDGKVLTTTASGIGSTKTCPVTGVCAPTLVGTFAATEGAEAMAGDESNVYWSATGHIYTCPFAGCPGDTPTSIANTTARVRAITLDSKNVYWGDDNGGLYRVAK